MSFKIQKSAPQENSNIWPIATMGDILFTISQHGSRTGSTYSFAIAEDKNVIPNPKLGLQS